MRLDLLSELNAERGARRAVVVVTDLASGAQRLVREDDIERDPLAERLKQQMALGKSARVESEAADYFIEVHLPAAIMVIVGAVHITQTLAPMAGMLGYDVTIVDPRSGFATPERFPQTTIVTSWPDQAFAKIKLDRRSTPPCGPAVFMSVLWARERLTPSVWSGSCKRVSMPERSPASAARLVLRSAP
jgi:xanthine dehydrogenase accessory factor